MRRRREPLDPSQLVPTLAIKGWRHSWLNTGGLAR